MKTAAFPSLILAALVAAGGTQARPPVVVELFTAQGCSSCISANALVAKLADRKGVIALTWNVDYWDYLGWKDTFAQSAFADRQHAYDKRFGLKDVYTPQVIVAGTGESSGDKPGAIDALISQARSAPANPPQMKMRDNGRLGVGSGRKPRGGAEVFLIRYDPRERTVDIKQGDNRGKAMVHRDVVRQLVRLGAWVGKPAVYTLPSAPEPGLSTLILLQGAHGGRIIGVMKTPNKA
jgi:hypothetical protein